MICPPTCWVGSPRCLIQRVMVDSATFRNLLTCRTVSCTDCPSPWLSLFWFSSAVRSSSVQSDRTICAGERTSSLPTSAELILTLFRLLERTFLCFDVPEHRQG